MDFGALPPEINSALMYAGAGSGPMVAAAAAWDGLTSELQSAASSYLSVVEELTTEQWTGPSSVSASSAFAPYVSWMVGAAARAEEAASHARLAVESYEAAFAMTVPPQVVTANRVQLASLIATNLFGQNTAAIAATEAQYAEMWAQDSTAMYSYAAGASEASILTAFTSPPEVANPAGLATQAAQATSTSAGTGVQSTLAQLASSITAALQSLASPFTSMTSASSTTGLFGTLTSTSGFSLGSLALEYADLPGFAAMFIGSDAVVPLFSTPMSTALAAASTPVAAAPLAVDAVAGPAEGAAAGAAEGALGSGFAGDLGAWAGLGRAASVGGLAVPPVWGWAAAGPGAAMLGSVPLEMLAPAAAPLDAGAGLGFPFMFPGLPRGAVAAGAGAAAGAAVAKYGKPRCVVARPPSAGYPPAEPAVVASTPKYPPVPAGFPTNGSTPPGYRAAVIYLPTDGYEPAHK